jgi:hypothetical protein
MRILFLFDGGRRQKQKQGIGPSTFAPSFAHRPPCGSAMLILRSLSEIKQPALP